MDNEKRVREIDLKIQDIKDAMEAEIEKLEEERWELIKRDKHYFVALFYERDFENYYDDYVGFYCPLGNKTEEYARNWVETHRWDSYCEVSEEEYNAIRLLGNVQKAYQDVVYSKIPHETEIATLLLDAEKELMAKTTLIESTSYQVVIG